MKAQGKTVRLFSVFQDTFSNGLYHTHEKNRGDDSMNILFASPDRDLLRWALQRAGYAPSGKNQRAYRFTVVYGPEKVAELRDLCARRDWDPAELALSGGEDYELLFTCRPGTPVSIPHTVIGEILAAPEGSVTADHVIIWEGTEKDFTGFRHF